MNHYSKLFSACIGLFLSGAFLASCNSNSNSNSTENAKTDSMTHSSTQEMQQSAVANISPSYADTAVEGKATFTTEADGQVKLSLTLHIPAKSNKEVAVHLHEHGDCGDMGKNAHGHWNPTNDTHGKWGSAHFHRGDIGNVKLDGEGNGTLEMTTDLWQIGGSDSTKNILGRAVIVHGGFDDFVSQPTGNAGNRIGCGVIQ